MYICKLISKEPIEKLKVWESIKIINCFQVGYDHYCNEPSYEKHNPPFMGEVECEKRSKSIRVDQKNRLEISLLLRKQFSKIILEKFYSFSLCFCLCTEVDSDIFLLKIILLVCFVFDSRGFAAVFLLLVPYDVWAWDAVVCNWLHKNSVCR